MIGAALTAVGYEVALKDTATNQYQIGFTDSSGNMTSFTAVLAANSGTLESYETSFHQDLNGDGAIGPAGTAIQTDTNSFGTTVLTQVGNDFGLYNNSGSGPLFQYAGAPVTVGEFGSEWTVIGAALTAVGYEVALKDTATNQYQIGFTDSSGNMTSFTAVLAANSGTLESYETSFHQDLNGDGAIGPAGTAIQTDTNSFGTTVLTQVGNDFGLYNNSGSGPLFQYAGAPVTVGEFGSEWTVIGAALTAVGYEVALKDTATNQYQIGFTDSSGNMTSFTAVLAANSGTLESYETSFHQDLNGDGAIGPAGTAIQTDTNSFGTTVLTQVGNDFGLYNNSGSGPLFQYAGAPVTVGEFGSEWTVIGAALTAVGYEVALKDTATNQYQIGFTDSSGNMTSFTAVLAANSGTLKSYETSFHQDLNGDGAIGPAGTAIQTDTNSFGTTVLTQVGNDFGLYNNSGSGPLFQYAGAPVTVGEFGSEWTVIGAALTAVGYEVALKDTATNQYQIGFTDSSGNMTSFTAVLAANSGTLESYETSFHQDLNGDGTIGPVVTAGATIEITSAYNGAVTFAASSGTLQLDDSLGFSGTVTGLSGQDTLDLKDIAFATVHTPTYSGTSTGGTLTVTDGTHTATIALSGNYLTSSFVASNDGHGGVDIIDPPVAGASTGVSIVSSATEEGVSGTITFTGVDASHPLAPSVVVDDTHYAVNFSLTSIGAGSGTEINRLSIQSRQRPDQYSGR